jgi:hypothetical protein
MAALESAISNASAVAAANAAVATATASGIPPMSSPRLARTGSTSASPTPTPSGAFTLPTPGSLPDGNFLLSSYICAYFIINVA